MENLNAVWQEAEAYHSGDLMTLYRFSKVLSEWNCTAGRASPASRGSPQQPVRHYFRESL